MRRTTPDRAVALFSVIAVASCAQTPADPAPNVTNPVRVTAGDPHSGGSPPPFPTDNCDVLVVGGGLGGVAAATAAADRGVDTCLTEETPWLGGQLSAQGVSAPDGNAESRLWLDLEARILQHYREPPYVPNTSGPFNPGDCAVSSLCHEPFVAAQQVDAIVQQRVTAGHLRLFRLETPVGVDVVGNTVTGVLFRPAGGGLHRINAKVTIDATEWGDLLPLAGVPYRTGMESQADTGEPEAPATGDPECVQPMTPVFVLEQRFPGENHRIDRPESYQPDRYSLTLPALNCPTGFARYPIFDLPHCVGGPPFPNSFSFWVYRRSVSSLRFISGAPYDVSMINWGPLGNDFDRFCVDLMGLPPGAGCNVIDRDPAARAQIMQRARELARGYVYWLQTDVPRDDDSGFGYPNLRLVTSAVGTTDGVSMIPYVRESRRIRAVTTIRQQDVALELLPDDWVRARMFDDTVGANLYGLDLHKCAAGTQNQVNHTETNPMQVPLGALLPQTMDGLLAGAKDIGTTHITNGGYRVHSSEFVIGRAAGETAALATQRHIQPRAVLSQRAQLRALQWRLVQDGDSLVWWNDVTLDDPLWPALQLSTAVGAFDAFAPRSRTFIVGQSVTRAQAAQGVVRATDQPPSPACVTPTPFNDVSCTHPQYPYIQRLFQIGATGGCGGGAFCPDASIFREQLAVFLAVSACDGQPSSCWVVPSTPSFIDVPTTSPYFRSIETLAAWGVFDDDPQPGGPRRFGLGEAATRLSVARWIARFIRYKFALP
jgi:FAD dependent oxidoreductase